MLTYPPLLEAHPGDPITAEGWNNLVLAVKGLYDALNKPQGTVIFKVADKADGSPVRGAVVSLFRKDGTLSRAAAFVGGSLNAYVAGGLPAGSYSVVLEAPDFAVENRDLEIAGTEGAQESAIQMTRTAVRAPMPNLFGLALADAQAQLGAAGLSLSRILDSHGNDIAPAAVPAEIKTARVLNQVPEAGLPVQAKDAVQLQVSAKVEVKLPVKVPKLLGMTYAQAQAALDAVGLKLAAPINGTK